jgi:hypothetical protein
MIHTKYILGNGCYQIINIYISDDTFEVLGQLRHWKVCWTQGNLTTQSINNIMTQQKNI